MSAKSLDTPSLRKSGKSSIAFATFLARTHAVVMDGKQILEDVKRRGS